MAMQSPADRTPNGRPRLPAEWLSAETLAVAAAAIFIVLVVAGIFPRVPW